MTTNLAAASGAVVTMIISWLKDKKPDVGATLNGALGGLVAITAGTDIVSFGGSILIGALAGFVIIYGSTLIEHVLKIDDPVGAIAVHGLSGALGTICVGLFATDGGLFYGGGLNLLGVQSLGVLTVALWTIATTFTLFKLIDFTLGLRVSAIEEETGLDLLEHGLISSYPDFETKKPIVPLKQTSKSI